MTQESSSPAPPIGAGSPSPAARTVGKPILNPAAATLRLYASDWTRFTQWCRETRQTPLPASPATVAAYLLAVAPQLSRGALGRRRAAIRTMHRQAGLPVPLLDATTRAALRAAARPASPTRPVPPTSASLQRMAAKCPRDLPGLRDSALLLLAAALTRSGRRGRDGIASATHTGETAEPVPRLFLLALDAEDIRFTAAGMTLQIRTRLDEASPTRPVMLTRGMLRPCPVRALEEWLRASDTAFGPVFRKIDRWGNVEHGRLYPDSWHRIIARRGAPSRRARAAGVPAH